VASLAENLSDAVVAPLLAYRIGGLRAAYLHRWINTADAVLGYRTEALEWFGKPAARADDLLNWIPARVTALCLALAAPLAGLHGREAARVALRDSGLTPSPNGGWPMAAAAGALGVRLEKRGVYTLHAEGRAPEPGDIAACRRLVAIAALIALALVESV
jgi:adenosylcobinamide-phosphate synthase